jgi:RsiW-degrading membrane proteinase PrsW (M82 family)
MGSSPGTAAAGAVAAKPGTPGPGTLEPDTQAPPRAAEPPPRKWLGPRGGLWISLGGAALLAALLVVGAAIGFHGNDLPPEPVILGALLVSAGLLYTLAYRLRPADGLSVARLLGAFGVAALVTTAIAGTINQLIALGAAQSTSLPGFGPSGFGITSTLFAGPVEETLKLVTVLLLGLRLPVKNFRTGMFLGGAVGLGFASLENIQYIAGLWQHPIYSLPPVGSLVLGTVARSFVTPLLHPILTALVGGALFAATRRGRYGITANFVGIFVAVVGIHSLWDSIPVGLLTLQASVSLAAFGGLAFLGLLALLAIVIGLPLLWRAFARSANDSARIDQRELTTSSGSSRSDLPVDA